jgi:hypothetical protein
MAMGDMKRLPSVVPGLPKPSGNTKLQKLLDQRISMTEAMSLVSKIVGCYPYTDNKTSDSYIGALVEVLISYPAIVARKAADTRQGIARWSKFLPNVGELTDYCESITEPLRKQIESEDRRQQQLTDRQNYLQRETEIRAKRLSLEELKEKYGDWTKWGKRSPPWWEEAKVKLIAEIGQEAFDQIPGPSP